MWGGMQLPTSLINKKWKTSKGQNFLDNKNLNSKSHKKITNVLHNINTYENGIVQNKY